MTTMYGTIPTLSSDFLEADKWNIKRSEIFCRIRPWLEMIAPFSLPESFNHSLSRLNSNGSYFLSNYIILLLLVIFLSMLWHPVSLSVFIVMMLAWLFLYFLRDDSVFVLGYEVDEHVVLTLLSILTVVLLASGATMNVVVAVSVGAFAVAVHGAFNRKADDLIMEADQGVRVVLKETASASFSSYA